MIQPTPDPVMQAAIDDSFNPVNLTLDESATVLCVPHSLEKCAECDVDFISLNRLSKLLITNPNLRCPPPAKVVSQKLSSAINNTKEEGNVRANSLLAGCLLTSAL